VHRSVSPTRLGSADADPREEVLVEVDVVVHVVTAVRVADAVTDELRRGRMRGGRRRVGPVDLSPLEYSLGNSVASIGTRPGSGDIDALFAGLEQLLADFSDDQVFGFELILESRRRPELRPHVEAMYSAYRAALRLELECAGIDCDDSLVHLVFAAVDGMVFQELALGHPDPTQAALRHLRRLLSSLTRDPRDGDRTADQARLQRLRALLRPLA
jgi:hypothetical protein